MNNILIGTNLKYQVNRETSFLLHFAVSQNAHQRVVQEETRVDQDYELEFCQVGELGNRSYRLLAKAEEVSISYRGEVELSPEVVDTADVGESHYRDLPADVLPYLNPSRYCESDKLNRLALAEFGGCTPGYTRVNGICDWVHEKVAYVLGSSNASTTACDVLLQRAGVCRDFAHVSISLCRAIGIPARYVSGYAVDLQPPDFHGLFEAYLEGRWFLFDATRLAPVAGFVRIGTGRDAADVAFATLIGDAVLMHKEVWANAASSSGECMDTSLAGSSGVSSA